MRTPIPSSYKAISTLLFAILGTACSREVPTQALTDPPSPTAETATGAPLETRPTNSAGYKPAFDGQTRAPGLKSDIELDITTIAEGLDTPWAFEFLPDGRILLTERGGNLRIVDKTGTLSAPARGLLGVHAEVQGGLLDVALDPQFASNKIIYWTYAEPRDGGSGTALAKGVLAEDDQGPKVEQVQVIFQQQPTLQSNFHFGSRIVFSDDGKLFLTLGERSVPAGRVQSQDLDSHFGKVVRLNLDGSIPTDNPFADRQDAKPEIWSYGHRNIQAAAIAADGRLWTIEHGPLGGDELNQPQAGLNYGWPIIGYGIEYSGKPIGDGITVKEGLEQPIYYWDPVIAPSGMIFYTGNMFPEWHDNIFVGGLAGKLVRLQLANDKVTGEEWLLTEQAARIRDVQQAPDGAIYVITDSTDGRLLRLSRKS